MKNLTPYQTKKGELANGLSSSFLQLHIQGHGCRILWTAVGDWLQEDHYWAYHGGRRCWQVSSPHTALSHLLHSHNSLSPSSSSPHSNGAVCGALMGCKLGYKCLPQDLLQFVHRQWLDDKVTAFLTTIGLQDWNPLVCVCAFVVPYVPWYRNTVHSVPSHQYLQNWNSYDYSECLQNCMSPYQL